MRSKRKHIGKQGQFKVVKPQQIDQVLSIIRHMPLFKRIKLALWLVSYNIVAVLMVIIISSAIAIHYVG